MTIGDLGIDYFGLDGEPIDFETFCAMSARRDTVRIGADKGYDVSGRKWFVFTVWLGIDHNWSADGPPLIFETMSAVRGSDYVIERHATREQALAFHKKTVATYEPQPVPCPDCDGRGQVRIYGPSPLRDPLVATCDSCDGAGCLEPEADHA